MMSSMDMKNGVVCPKQKLSGSLAAAADDVNDPTLPLLCDASAEEKARDADADAEAENELLEILLKKGESGDADQDQQQPAVPVPVAAVPVASSPPFYIGSPPCRVSNPLVRDANFGKVMVFPVSPSSFPIPAGLGSSPTSSARTGGCVRANFGNNPAVRVEGFDCLDRDRRNCSIPTLA